MSDDMKQDIAMLKTHVAGLLTTTKNTAVAVSRVESRLSAVESGLRLEISSGFARVMERLDEFSGEVQASRRERALQDQSFNVLNQGLTDHEVRLTRLEREKRS